MGAGGFERWRAGWFEGARGRVWRGRAGKFERLRAEGLKGGAREVIPRGVGKAVAPTFGQRASWTAG